MVGIGVLRGTLGYEWFVVLKQVRKVWTLIWQHIWRLREIRTFFFFFFSWTATIKCCKYEWMAQWGASKLKLPINGTSPSVSLPWLSWNQPGETTAAQHKIYHYQDITAPSVEFTSVSLPRTKTVFPLFLCYHLVLCLFKKQSTKIYTRLQAVSTWTEKQFRLVGWFCLSIVFLCVFLFIYFNSVSSCHLLVGNQRWSLQIWAPVPFVQKGHCNTASWNIMNWFSRQEK